jgi:hypothetical protein
MQTSLSTDARNKAEKLSLRSQRGQRGSEEIKLHEDGLHSGGIGILDRRREYHLPPRNSAISAISASVFVFKSIR